MLVDFRKFSKDPYGNVEAPEMVLETLHDEVICTVDNYYDLQLELKFIDESKITFKVPEYDNGVRTACYDELFAMRKVDVSPFGIYVLDEPKTVFSDGKAYKEFTGSSEESLLSNKNMVLEEGTYRFYSATDIVSSNPSTIMGIVHSIIPNWNISVDRSLWEKYRTFEETNTSITQWLKDVAAKSFGCLFNFDSGTKTLYVIDANAEYSVMDVLLTHDNLLKSGSNVEYTKEMLTVLDVYGADPLNIREVNPIGSNKIYNLDYFIENGDIHGSLANKWRSWQNEIAVEQTHFSVLLLMKSSAIMHQQALSARCRALKDEVQDLTNQIETCVAEIAVTDDATTKASLKEEYARLVAQRTTKETEVAALDEDINAVQSEIDDYISATKDINRRLAYNAYFTNEERSILDHYLLENDFADSSFAAFDVDISGQNDVFQSGVSTKLYLYSENEEDFVEIDTSQIDGADVVNKRIFMLNGGSFEIRINDTKISAKIISGTIDVDKSTDELVCSIYTGSGSCAIDNGDRREFANANISIICDGSQILKRNDNYEITIVDCAFYLTRNNTQFESYAKQKELLDYAVEQHKSIAYPSYQFDIASGNILFANEFEEFKDKLRLGCGVYLELEDETILTPLLLEIHFSFEDSTKFDLVFSNTYRRHDNVQSMRDLLHETSKSTRSLEMAKYNYGAFNKSGAESEVRTLFTQGLNAAKTQILAGKNNCVSIDGSGIKISSTDDPSVYIKMNNGMIAFMDESNKAQLAIGKFYDTGMGDVMYGVVAPNVVGTLLAGENLVIQSTTIDGSIMHFTVDATGAKLANGVFDLYRYSDETGSGAYNKTISLNPDLGIIVGDLENAIAYDESGNISGVYVAMDAGSSENVGSAESIADAKESYSNAIANLRPNFWVDLDGNVFMRGTVYATDGVFSGTVYAQNGEFSGNLNAAVINGELTAGENAAIRGISISVGGTRTDPNFAVDSDGNVTLKGNITWGESSTLPPEVSSFISTVSDYMDANDEDIISIQRQLDGQIETFYYDYAPTLNNEPASQWVTDADKAAHEGDMFFDKSTGHSYRFLSGDNGYEWVRIVDTEAEEALMLASKAQDTADGKRRNFLTTPTPPYDKGDIWMNGSEILVCTTAKSANGSYARSDWESKNKYTDDTVAKSIANGTYSGGTFINGTTISAPKIYGSAILGVGANSAAEKKYNFFVDSNGDVYMNGSIKLNGNITWGSGKNPVTRTAVLGIIKNTDGIFNDNGNIRVNASYITAGTLDADRINLNGTFKVYKGDTQYGLLGYNHDTTTINGATKDTYGVAMYGYGKKYYVYVSNYGGRLSSSDQTRTIYVSDAYAVIKSGNSKVECGGNITRIDGSSTTYINVSHNDNVWLQCGATSNESMSSIRLFGPSNGDSSLRGAIYLFGKQIHLSADTVVKKDGSTVYSDRNLKYDISYDMDKYEKFYKNIKPASYKVIYGKSGRSHTGFIAPDIENALIESGLSTSDFAGYVMLHNAMNPAGEGFIDVSALRYEEFISLNTYMIQKLMARVEELETKLGGIE